MLVSRTLKKLKENRQRSAISTIFIVVSLVIGNKILKGRIDSFSRLADKTALSNIRICFCKPDRDNIKIQREDGLNIIGSLYGINGKHKRPGILLLHGSTVLGRKYPMYRVLAKKLAAKGYLVLAIDFTGYGESDNPFILTTTRPLTERYKDVIAALNYFKTVNNLDRNRINLVAHSGGTPPAFEVGIKEPLIKKIVTIGPPRRVTERLQDQDPRNHYYGKDLSRMTSEYRQIYGEELPAYYTYPVYLQDLLHLDMTNYIGYFSSSSHKPLLLIDGDLEDSADQIYLRNYYQNITEPKQYITITNSDHYMNIQNERSNKLMFYDQATVNKHTRAISEFLENDAYSLKNESNL